MIESRSNFKQKIEKLKVVAEPNRLRILMMLSHKSLCVCEITSLLGLTTATVSKHLSILNKAGFIIDTKDGRWINYSLVPRGVDFVVDELLNYIEKWYKEEQIVQRDYELILTINRDELICSPNKCVL